VTTTFFLVRHAAHDNIGGFLAGRAAGVTLGPAGLAQADRLAARMRRERLDAVYASPRERTRQTAAAIADAGAIGPVRIAEELDEIDFGEWSGRTFDDLNTDPRWRTWNEDRPNARTPAGESMVDVEARILGLLGQLASECSGKRLALVSHADVIKAVVIHMLGMPLGGWDRFDIGPASITTVVQGPWGSKVLGLNEVVS
jgi:broad specificity phosphatase PhoE